MKTKTTEPKKGLRQLSDEELKEVTGGAGILKQVGVTTVPGAANGLKSNQCPAGSTVTSGGLCFDQLGDRTPNF